MKTSAEIMAHYRKISILSTALELVGWDMETYMPPGAAPLRGEQLGLLSEIHHREMTRQDFVDASLSFDTSKLADQDRKQMVRLQEEIQLSRVHSPEFISKREEARVKTQRVWHEAKKKKDFKIVRDALGDLVKIQRDWAQAVKDSAHMKSKYGHRSLYEIHMDQFEPGQPSADVRRVLSELGVGLKKLLPEILAKQKSGAASKTAFAMKTEKQQDLCHNLSTRLGFDFQKGRLDRSAHPFCGGSPGDVRITVRYDESDLTESLYGLIHETGHALYEQGLPEANLRTPCGRAVSLGFHESQSRFMENQIGRSPAFCDFLAKLIHVTPAKVTSHIHQIEKSFIRTESDEVSYNLHILLRMAIEEDLMEGKLSVKDLPERWNSDFKDLFGIKVPNDSLGCMQDIHWYGGAFGYFPTYSLGNLIAAELFALYTKEYPRWKTSVKNGQFRDTKKFLNERVHSLAGFDDSPTTLKKIIGKSIPDPQVFLTYLRDRYLP